MKDYIYRMMDERKDLATKACALGNFKEQKEDEK